ncbi:MAG: radical SAM protein [Blautia sp.]|nr:radical SAM protein [Blautia sp.]
MGKIKRFIDCYIPTETCNLRCHYCYITQKRRFNAVIASFTHTPAEIRTALSKDRLGGTCLMNLCAGGETLLSQDVLPVVKELLREGHYVMIVTNGTISHRFDEILQWEEELLKHLFIKFSFHYLELIRLKWLDRFFENVNKMKKAGVSFTVEVTPSDELVPYIEEMKGVCLKNLGALCHITIARDDKTHGIEVLSALSWDDYKNTWNEFDSALFEFKTRIFKVKRKEFCYAGAWSYYLDLKTGRLKQCYKGNVLGNIYEDISAPIPQKPVGSHCPLPHCYNGHAFLALGDIPELPAPTYAEERNRICADGSEWLQPEVKAFMSSKLYETNKQYGLWKKKVIALNQWAVQRGIRDTRIYRLFHKA